MGFMDNIKNFMNANDGLEDEDFGVEEETFEEKEPVSTSFFETKETSAPARSKYLNIHANSKLSVVLVKPESYAEAKEIADHLNQKRTVVLNLESTGKDVSRRLVDFLSGVAYANDGDLKRVANSTFIITPYNVDIMGDEMLEDFTENSGIYIWCQLIQRR